MTARRMVVAVLAVASLIAFPGVSLGDTFRVRATGSTPTDFEWTPRTRHVSPGDRIRWKNTTSARHRVVAYSNNWSKNTEIGPDETTAKRFTRTGAYKYRCTLPGHSTLTSGRCTGMCGVIHVMN